MGEFARALGMSETVKHKGSSYKLSPMSFEVIGRWEQYLEENAWDALDRQKARGIASKRFNFDEHTKKEQGLIAAITAGDYEFYKPVSAKAMGDPMGKGWRKMLWIRMNVLDPEVTEALVEEIFEEQAEKLMQLVARADAADPNSQAPVETPGSSSEPEPSSPACEKVG